MKVTGEEVPDKIDTFHDANLSLLMTNISESMYLSPTLVQKYALPMVLGGRDMMGCVQTGSGKTAAFLFPIIHKLLEGEGVEGTPPPIQRWSSCPLPGSSPSRSGMSPGSSAWGPP